MSYPISSKQFDNPLLKPLLKDLTSYFSSIGMDFYIIGATARDIIFNVIHNHNPERKTFDLDIAIAIPNWEAFDKIADDLCSIEGFAKCPKQKQRFIYNDAYELDIVPFGNVARSDSKIYWPPEESHCMNVKGFEEITQDTLSLEIDGEITVKVASLPGIFLLKLIAWVDRGYKTNKDAEDLSLIIANYLPIHQEDLPEQHYDIYDDEDYSEYTAGAVILGRDLAGMLRGRKDIGEEIVSILQSEIKKDESSRLINGAMRYDQLLKFEQVMKAFGTILHEIQANT